MMLILAVGAAATVEAQAWQFTGESLSDDFTESPFPGWQPSTTTSGYLGPNTGASLFLMDFGDDLQGEERLVDISFKLVDPVPGSNQLFPLTLTINGDAHISELRVSLLRRYGVSVPSDEINLDFFPLPDLQVEFTNPENGSAFGLDDVVVDWSQPVLPGDYNDDSVVGAADYTAWRDNVGASDALLNDAIKGTIGSAHYEQWREHFGRIAAVGEYSGATHATPVPEPAIVSLVVTVALLCYRAAAGLRQSRRT
jgi:hypothetical protein